MRKEKLIVSLVVMIIVFVACGMSVFASDTGTKPITTITQNNASGTTQITAGSNTNSNGNTNGTQINASNSSAITPITGSNTNAAANTNSGSSTYTTRNNTNNTNTQRSESLPYTGVSYGVVFVIIALVVSAVYAYKKVSDYNM